ncbi:MAG: DNA polymerase III subunit beta [Planctomycetes bacterium]|nr:DNA polymerase III subunit beta [Planctomycetota bacterium]MBL7044377.1 DNA polymerase III subunit beta [Pirellulaceae bacterium]
MKITCDRELLLSAFQTAAMVAPSRSPKPILQNVKLEIEEQSKILMATDMEVGVRIALDGIEVESAGSAVLPVTRFGSILRENSDEKLQVEADAQGVKVRGERSEFNLPGQNPDEFPSVVSFEEEKYHKIPARLFRELVRRTIFATDTESSRYALGGVLLEMEADSITAVGTDGRRLAKMNGTAESIGGHETGETMTIVPSRSMQLMERALTDGEGEILIAARGNDVLIKSAKATLYSRLVEGRFPKWRDVFPVRQDALQINITVGPMYSALRQAAIVTDEESRGVDFTFGEGKLILAGSTAEVGQSRVELPIPYEGEAIILTLDHRFVADFLKVLEAEKTFTVEIENEESAALFSTEDGYGYVVMPLARDR